jgi:hypothetical protein
VFSLFSLASGLKNGQMLQRKVIWQDHFTDREFSLAP